MKAGMMMLPMGMQMLTMLHDRLEFSKWLLIMHLSHRADKGSKHYLNSKTVAVKCKPYIFAFANLSKTAKSLAIKLTFRC